MDLNHRPLGYEGKSAPNHLQRHPTGVNKTFGNGDTESSHFGCLPPQFTDRKRTDIVLLPSTAGEVAMRHGNTPQSHVGSRKTYEEAMEIQEQNSAQQAARVRTGNARTLEVLELAIAGDFSPVLANSKHFSLEDALSKGVERSASMSALQLPGSPLRPMFARNKGQSCVTHITQMPPV